MITTFIGLGSNVGDRLAALASAVAALDASNGITYARNSSVYETAAVGPAQPDYLNAVVEVRTTLRPHALLARLKAIERDLGRIERERWGPREIDLDLLLYGEETVSEPGLRVPHAELEQRAFVLVPLADLAPFARVPGSRLVAELLEDVDRHDVRFAHPAGVLWPDHH